MNNNFKHVLAFTLFSLPFQVSAMEEVKPCSQDECVKLRKEFEERGCDSKCRSNLIEKLATQFDPKKDSQLLRNLLCAQKELSKENITDGFGQKVPSNSPVFTTTKSIYPKGCAEDGCTSLPDLQFITYAVQAGNIPFLKIFFNIFSKNGTVLILWNNYYRTDLKCDTKELLKNEETLQLVVTNAGIRRYEWKKALELCKDSSPQQLPGCAYVARKLIEKQTAKQQFEASLRTIGTHQ